MPASKLPSLAAGAVEVEQRVDFDGGHRPAVRAPGERREDRPRAASSSRAPRSAGRRKSGAGSRVAAPGDDERAADRHARHAAAGRRSARSARGCCRPDPAGGRLPAAGRSLDERDADDAPARLGGKPDFRGPRRPRARRPPIARRRRCCRHTRRAAGTPCSGPPMRESLDARAVQPDVEVVRVRRVPECSRRFASGA